MVRQLWFKVDIEGDYVVTLPVEARVLRDAPFEGKSDLFGLRL